MPHVMAFSTPRYVPRQVVPSGITSIQVMRSCTGVGHRVYVELRTLDSATFLNFIPTTATRKRAVSLEAQGHSLHMRPGPAKCGLPTGRAHLLERESLRHTAAARPLKQIDITAGRLKLEVQPWAPDQVRLTLNEAEGGTSGLATQRLPEVFVSKRTKDRPGLTADPRLNDRVLVQIPIPFLQQPYPLCATVNPLLHWEPVSLMSANVCQRARPEAALNEASCDKAAARLAACIRYNTDTSREQ